MSYLVSPADVLVVKVWTTDAEQAAVNRFYVTVSSVTGASKSQLQIAQNYDAALAPLYKLMMNNQVSYRGVEVQRVWPLPVIDAESTVANAGAGTGGAQQLARQTCGVISSTTLYAGPPYRGRLYLPFPAAALQDATLDVPVAGYLANALTVAGYIWQQNVVVGGGNSATLLPVIWHGKYGYPARTPPIVPYSFTYISGFNVQSRWGTQRRRGDYGRPNRSPI
jgi:hypothetical protein